MRSALGKMLVPFSLVMIAAGLWQVGGPEQARMEQRDMIRMQDVRALASYLRCKSPDVPGQERDCGPMPDQTDRFTNLPFTVDDDRVCAEFEQSEQVIDALDSQFTQGCLRLD